MNPNKPQTGFSKSLYCFVPLLIYIGISYVIAAIYEMFLAVTLMAGNPNLSVDELKNSVINEATAQNSKLMIAISVVVLIVMGILFLKKEFRSFDQNYQNRIRPLEYLGTIGLSIGVFIAVTIIIQILYSIFGNTALFSSYTDTMELLLQDKFWINLLSVGILAPISEELLFRGLIFNRMRYYMHENYAIVFSSLVFALMHAPTVIQIIYAFLLGCVLSYAYSKFENILVPILIHMVFNLSNFPFMTNALKNFPSTVAQSLLYYGLGVVLCAVGLRMLIKKRKPATKL
ncbi:MAG: lysostaphin resistance A-like protein [Anaerofustis sp.]